MPKTIWSAEQKDFLTLLRSRRETRGISQVAIAKMLGMTQSMYSKVERGERRADFVEVWRICRALKIPFSKFAAEFDRKARADR